jgi:hypothetical protein
VIEHHRSCVGWCADVVCSEGPHPRIQGLFAVLLVLSWAIPHDDRAGSAR